MPVSTKFTATYVGKVVNLYIYIYTLYIYTPMKPYFKENCRGISRDIIPRVREYIFSVDVCSVAR